MLSASAFHPTVKRLISRTSPLIKIVHAFPILEKSKNINKEFIIIAKRITYHFVRGDCLTYHSLFLLLQCLDLWKEHRLNIANGLEKFSDYHIEYLFLTFNTPSDASFSFNNCGSKLCNDRFNGVN